MRMRFVPDQAILQAENDGLGFSKLVETMHDSFQNTTCPFVYGVIGDWGSGKTSIMRILFNRLDKALSQGEKKDWVFVPIWFDAWLYENEANVVYPLLYAIRKSLIDRYGEDALKGLEESFLTVAKGTLLALTDLGLRTVTQHFIGEKLQLKDVKEALDLASQDKRLTVVEEALREWTDKVGGLQAAFESLLKGYAAKLGQKEANRYNPDKVRFVIFIDDLDRCLPDTVVRILESIKNFLTASNCIFVLGINPRVVYQGIRAKYPTLEVDGREYLEKIINYSFYVPDPDVKLAQNFAKKLLDNLLLDEKPAAMDGAFADFAQALQQSRFTNPRKIKRILNRYLLFLNEHGFASAKFSNLNTVRLIVLAEYFPSLFSLFLSSAEAVRKELYSVGEGANLKTFEEKYGVPLAPIYRQVTVMKDLFVFQTGATLAQLSDHVEAVFAITRSL